MKKYTIYFELFSKKIKTTVEAESEIAAKQKIVANIKWHKIFEEKSEQDKIKHLWEMLGLKH